MLRAADPIHFLTDGSPAFELMSAITPVPQVGHGMMQSKPDTIIQRKSLDFQLRNETHKSTSYFQKKKMTSVNAYLPTAGSRNTDLGAHSQENAYKMDRYNLLTGKNKTLGQRPHRAMNRYTTHDGPLKTSVGDYRKPQQRSLSSESGGEASYEYGDEGGQLASKSEERESGKKKSVPRPFKKNNAARHETISRRKRSSNPYEDVTAQEA